MAATTVAALTAPAPALAGGDGSFTQAPDSPVGVGSTPDALAVADFNGDGDPDLAVANRDSADLSILVGGPGASFEASPPVALDTDGLPTDVVAGDFNQDGDPDLAIAQAHTGVDKVTIFTGAAGTDFTASEIPVNQGPNKIAVGKYNADDDLDLAVLTGRNERVAILTGGAGSSFAIANTDKGVSDGATGIVTGDFDANGTADLATVGTLPAHIEVLTGNNAATFALQPTLDQPVGQSPQDLVVADFNGDNDPDLATADFSDNTVTRLSGAGGAAFAAGQPFPAGANPSGLVSGDLNGDGRADLAVADRAQGAGAGTVSILLGDGAGSFSPGPGSPVAVGSEPLAVTSADFNGDGSPDLATADGGADTVTVLVGKDTEAPDTTIDKGPKRKTDKRKAKIAYSADEPATFECRLKGKGVAKKLRKFSDCGDANAKYKHLKAGKKKFQVRAVDAAGNVDPTPAKLKWKITG